MKKNETTEQVSCRQERVSVVPLPLNFYSSFFVCGDSAPDVKSCGMQEKAYVDLGDF